MKMATYLSMLLALLFSFIFISHLSSARTIARAHHVHHHHHHRKMTFLMLDVLTNATHYPSSTAEIATLPFSKPLGFIPPDNGIPLIPYNNPITSTPTTTPDVTNSNMFFPGRGIALQELDFGFVTTFDEPIFGDSSLEKVGRAQGICISSSENYGGSNHMVAITTTFGFKDGLRLFGVHQRSSVESHVAVIGGTGKFLNANGYATIKRINHGPTGDKKLLLFNVYVN